MKPVEISITALIKKSPEEICAAFLDTNRWTEFTGYSILPGIEKAHFESKTPDLIGSRIKVSNTDGSIHVEEIIEWDVRHRIALRFQEFSSPVKYLASHFIEIWEFRQSADGTLVSRIMIMYPKGIFGRLMLVPISKLMKRAFEKNMTDTM